MDQTKKLNPTDFWTRCAAAGCIVVAIRLYSRYNEAGDFDEADFIGVKFTTLKADLTAVGPGYWFMVDDQAAGLGNYHSTPDDALIAFEHARNLKGWIK